MVDFEFDSRQETVSEQSTAALLEALIMEVSHLRTEIAELRASHDAIKTIAASVADDVKPMLDKLQSNPMLKMLF